jgi:hypothetical protein
MYPLKVYDQVIYYYYQEVQAKQNRRFLIDKKKGKSFTSGGPLNE